MPEVPFDRPTNLPELTGIRFVAALAVFLNHAALATPVSTGVAIALGVGRTGVSLFFVLSGLILTHNYLRRFRDGVSPTERREFYVARFARIYPAYLFALLFATPVALMQGARHLPVGTLATSWLANVTMLQIYSLDFNVADLWNPPAWSVACEVAFYAAFPFLLPWLARRFASGIAAFRGLLWTLVAMAGLYALGGLAMSLLEPSADIKRYYFLLSHAVYRTPFFRIQEFVAGCLLGLALTAEDGPFAALRRSARARGLALSWCVAWLALITGFTLTVDPDAGRSQTLAWGLGWYVLPTIAFVPLLGALASGKTVLTAFLSSRTALLLGEASYSFYLVHQIVLEIVARFTHGSSWLVPLLALPLATALAIGIHLWVEKPARAFLRRRMLGAARPSGVPG